MVTVDPPPDVPAPKPGLVLLVEDDDMLSRMVAMGLRRDGVRVETARDGEEGLARARELAPDVILSDWMMPRMDGLALCKVVKADPVLRSAVFILLTAKQSVADRIAGLDAGADEFLSKPVQITELSARVRAALRLRALQGTLAVRAKDLEELNRLKDEFLGMAAHDLRSPLGTVRMWIEALRDGMGGPLTPELSGGLGTIDRQIGGMLDLVNDLLDITRIRSGKVRFEPVRLEVGPLVGGVAEQHRIGAQRKRQALAVEPGPRLWVQGDPARLDEILANLLQNAIKYTPEG
ncbi:MAG: response regulator, partial [Planctomycetes bacterium]|nr:response regulator [Planctomycetota bacterium]